MSESKSESTKSETEKIKAKLKVKKAIVGPDYSNGLSTGSTLLNLAYTGRPTVGYVPGNYFFFVGDSDTGKSFLTLVAMAEAARNDFYKDHSFYFDNVEEGVQMDIGRYFGKDMARRLQAPQTVKGVPQHSTTVEEFYFNLDDCLDRGPCIYVLDSMDALSSVSEGKHFSKLKKALHKESTPGDDEGEKVSGSYGDGKAKFNSSTIRQMLPKISKTDSILIIIAQTRDNVGSFSFEKKTKSGGRSLDFYAQVQTWTSLKKQLKKPVRGTDRHVGNLCTFHVKRSRFTGRKNKIDIPIYFSHGVDDVGSCVDFLIEEKHWSKTKQSIEATEFEFKGTREKLIELIEGADREPQLQSIVAQVWLDIEEAMSINRKKKYQ
jgi:hypothetical protein